MLFSYKYVFCHGLLLEKPFWAFAGKGITRKGEKLGKKGGWKAGSTCWGGVGNASSDRSQNAAVVTQKKPWCCLSPSAAVPATTQAPAEKMGRIS